MEISYARCFAVNGVEGRMKITVIILSLFVAGCTSEENIITAYDELVAAQEELINVLEVKVKLLEFKCTTGHEI